MLLRSTCLSSCAILLAVSLAAAQPPGGTPGGFGGPPQPGQIVPGFLQERLKLTEEQKKQVEELQKEVDEKLAKILTAEQKKSLQELRNSFGGPGGPGSPGGRPFGGGFGPGTFGGFGSGFGLVRMDEVKKRMGATDEEWKVVGPKLQKVIAARQVLTADSRTVDAGAIGPQRTKGRPGGPPAGEGSASSPGDAPRPAPGFGGSGGANIISEAQADLKAVLDDPRHSKAEVQEKVAAVRKARQKAHADLDFARKDLLMLITGEQEAVLVSLGILE